MTLVAVLVAHDYCRLNDQNPIPKVKAMTNSWHTDLTSYTRCSVCVQFPRFVNIIAMGCVTVMMYSLSDKVAWQHHNSTVHKALSRSKEK